MPSFPLLVAVGTRIDNPNGCSKALFSESVSPPGYILRALDSRNLEVIEPHLGDAVRMAFEQAQEVNVALQPEQVFPRFSREHEREATPVPVLRNDRCNVFGGPDKSGDVTCGNPGLIRERYDDKICCRATHYYVEADA